MRAVPVVYSVILFPETTSPCHGQWEPTLEVLKLSQGMEVDGGVQQGATTDVRFGKSFWGRMEDLNDMFSFSEAFLRQRIEVISLDSARMLRPKGLQHKFKAKVHYYGVWSPLLAQLGRIPKQRSQH